MAVEVIKKLVHPIWSTNHPEGTAIYVRPNAMNDVKRANCVAVNRTLHNAERNATKAVEPSPPVKLSDAIATKSPTSVAPFGLAANQTKKRLVIA